MSDRSFGAWREAWRRRARRPGPLVAVVLALAVGVRLWGLAAQSLSMDEVAELIIAGGSVGDILRTRDGFPPLHALLLHAWLAAFPGDVAARGLSVAAGTLAVPAMWRLGLRIGGERTGIGAALALALSPFHIWFSQEIRAYAIYLLLAVVALWLFFRAMATNRTTDWLLYALACAVGAYTHYFFSLLALTAGMIFLGEKRGRLALVPGIVGNAALALACLPLLGFLRDDLAYQQGYSLEAPFTLVTAGYSYFTFATGFALGPSLRELHSLPSVEAIRMVLPWGLAAAAALSTLLYVAAVTIRPRVITVRLIAFAVVPVLIGGVLAEIFGVGFRVRYLAWVAVPILALVGAALAAVRLRAASRIAAGLLLTLWGIAIVNRRTDPRYWNEDIRALARFLRTAPHASPTVFVMSDYMAVPVEYYLGDAFTVCALPSLPSGSSDTSGPLRVIVSHAAPDSPFWLVYSRPFHSDPARHVPRSFVTAGLMKSRASFAGIELYEGRTGPRDPSLAPLACEDPPELLPNPS